MTDAEMIELTGCLRTATEAIRRDMARAMIDWDVVEKLVQSSPDPIDLQDLIDLAVGELRAHSEFPQVCANVYRI